MSGVFPFYYMWSNQIRLRRIILPRRIQMISYNIPVRRCVIKTVIFIVICLTLMIVFNIYIAKYGIASIDKNDIERHKSIVNRFYQSRKLWSTSKLGAVLYKNEAYPKISEEKKSKTFVILLWKHWKQLEKRHVYNFGHTRRDPLSECSVTNCIFTGDDDKLKTADAVVVFLHHGNIPPVGIRNESQRWIFLNDEAPFNVFNRAKFPPKLSELHNVFNWSMTYRSNADIPVPYGRTVPLKIPLFPFLSPQIANIIVPNWKHKRRDVLAAILISDCQVSNRMKLLKELMTHVKVDVFGKCGNEKLRKSCPGYFKADCNVISDYLFYLSFENSKCTEYITEKLFYNAYAKGSIPIIRGPSLEECKNFLPPNSYLHVENYATMKDLAADIVRISKDDQRLLHYHKWRNHFAITNEHGYFGTNSFHLCRLCEAMNYNDDEISVYSEKSIRQFLDSKILCASNYFTL